MGVCPQIIWLLKLSLKKNSKKELKNFVTKDFLKKEFAAFRKKLRDEDLASLRKEIRGDIIGFFDGSLLPLLDKMSNQIEEIKDITNNHEIRLDKHEDKLFVHDQKIKKIEASFSIA